MKKKQLTLVSSQPEHTEQFAATIGAVLRGNETIELVSDLGGGKTTFTRGLARGAGSTDTVASPTFTISKVYKTPNFEIHHFDFYRLQDAGLAAHELHDSIIDPEVVTVVEWGEIVEHVLPDQRLTIELTRTGDEQRQLTLSYPDALYYLVEQLC